MTKNKIYTKTGDDGTTSLIGGDRVNKDDYQVSAYGDIDELNACLGLCRSIAQEKSQIDLVKKLEEIQNTLFEIGSILATKKEWKGMPEINQADILKLETWIDALDENLPELKNFILPGTDQLSAHLHLARATCRRAERSIIHLTKSSKVPSLVLTYINRLSDLLFIMARSAAHNSGANDLIWSKRNT